MDKTKSTSARTTKVEDYKKELCFILFSQKKVIVAVTLFISLIAALIAFFWPPTYSSSGTILLRGKKVEKSPEALEETELRYFKLTKEDLFSEEQVLLSRNVLDRTIKYLQDNKLIGNNKMTEEIDNMFIKGNLKTAILPSSNIIEITNYNKEANMAAIILNALMEQYLIYRIQMHNPDKVASFFDKQAKRFKQGLVENDNELINIVQKNKMSDPLMEVESNLLIKRDLEFKLNELKNEVIGIHSLIEQLEDALNNDKKTQFFSFIKDSVSINKFALKLQELLIEKMDKLRIYHPSSEVVIMIEKHINNTYRSLKDEVVVYKENLLSELQRVSGNIQSIEERINVINTRNVTLKKLHIEAGRINHESKLLQASYETFFKRKEETLINSGTIDTDIISAANILNEAVPSEEPAFPKKRVIIPLGIIVGFITGCSLGFLKDYFDNTFKRSDTVYAHIDMPTIFSIPEYKRKAI